MQFLSAPIFVGQEGEAVAKLQDVISWFIKERHIDVSQPEQLDQLMAFKQEQELKFYGRATDYFVTSIRNKTGAWGGESNQITVDAAGIIEDFYLSNSTTDKRRIYGRIVNENGVGVPTVKVELLLKTLRDKSPIAGVDTDKRGYYEISFDAIPEMTGAGPKMALQIRATSLSDIVVKSPLIFNVGKETSIDLILPVANGGGMETEFSVIEAKIREAVGAEELPKLMHQDLGFLKSINENENIILTYLYAVEYAQLTKDHVEAEIFYGLLRANGIASYQAISNWSVDQMESLLARAVAANYISFKDSGRLAEAATQTKNSAISFILQSKSQGPKEAPMIRILGMALTEEQTKNFLEYYHSKDTLDADFWSDENLQSAILGASTQVIHNLKKALGYSIATGNNPRMVAYAMEQDITGLVSRTEEEWFSLIKENYVWEDFVIPDFITGENENDRHINYANYVYDNFSKGYKKEVTHNRIINDGSGAFAVFSDNLPEFIVKNPGFDVTKASYGDIASDKYDLSFLADDEKQQFIEDAGRFINLYALTGDANAVYLLVEKGFPSSSAIDQVTESEFKQAFGEDATKIDTSSIYQKNISSKTLAQSLVVEALQTYVTDLPFIYSTTSSTSNPGGNQPSWRSLFGNVDYCTCDHCLSVFSPAAYFVDCMELLRRFDVPLYNNANTSTTPAYEWLKTKRLDLWDVKLTCKNTNTSIPAIDIVNEILETIIGIGTAPVASPNMGYLNTAKETFLDARQNRAIPEYISSAGNYTPYHKLLRARYPWSAPYNYYADQCYAYLKIIDLKPYQIAQAFSKEPYPKTLNSIELACSYLGLTNNLSIVSGNSDLKVLVDIDPTNLHVYYGLTNPVGSVKKQVIFDPVNRSSIAVPSNLQTGFLEKVSLFLQQAQISFQDLLELLDCQYVNPGVWINDLFARKVRITGIPETTCDTDKMEIVIDALGGRFPYYTFNTFLFNAMRVTRLSRKTGLSKYDIDQILTAYGLSYDQPIGDAVIIFIAQVLRAKELLKAPLEVILPFWSDFPHQLYKDYTGDRPQQIPTSYERLFRNQSIVPDFENIPGYPFPKPSDYNNWRTASAPTYEQTRSWILAMFNLSNGEFEYLFKNFYADATLFDPAIFTLSNPQYSLSPISPNFAFNVFNTAKIPKKFATSEKVFNFTHNNILHLYREITLARLLNIPIEKWVDYRRWIFRHGEARDPFYPDLKFASPPTSVPLLPDATPLLRFIEKVKVFEGQSLPFDVMRYAFWDGFGNLQEKEVKRTLLMDQLAGLRDTLSKIHLDYQDTFVDANSVAHLIFSSKKIQDLLLSIVDPQDADFLVNGIALKNSPTPATPVMFSQEEIDRFDALLIATSSTAGTAQGELFGNTPNASSFKADSQGRLETIINVFLPALKVKANSKELLSYLSAQNSISTAFADLLLSNYIDVAGKKGIRVLTEEGFVKSSQPIIIANLSTAPLAEPFQVVEKLHKIALVINSLHLSMEEYVVFKKYYTSQSTLTAIDFLYNPVVGNVLTNILDNWLGNLDDSYTFIEWMQIRNAFVPSPLGLQHVLSQVPDPPTSPAQKEDWVVAISKALQIAEPEIELLVGNKTVDGNFGSLGFNFGLGFPQPFQYRKLFAAIDIMSWLEASAAMCVEVTASVLSPDAQSDADKIIQLVKSRYGKEEWLDVVQPVSDVLRVNRRDAMVAYLLAYPPAGYENRWFSELDLFETLLIDTQVMPIVQTSRIRQAISSIQLFFDRCILQKEVDMQDKIVVLGGEAIRQWNMWRKWYRIWEANRKVFVYPENWIEPELRDDKSPFFKELEKFVNQNDITPETMEDAYKAYLERLDEVAFLDVIGYYVEELGGELDSIIHVFGRTRSHPHLYYYRKRVDRVWTAWEKMEAQIDGDHFVPVMWRGRLRLYWVTFLEKIIPETQKVRADEEQKQPKTKYELLLHWTEYKSGKWTPSQLGSQKANLDFSGEAAGYSTAEEIKYHIKRRYNNDVNDWAYHGLAHTQKSYERAVTRMKERMLVYALKGGDGELYIECDTYIEGLTYAQYRYFLFKEYSRNFNNANVREDNGRGAPVDDQDAWFAWEFYKHEQVDTEDNNHDGILPDADFDPIPFYYVVPDHSIVNALDWNTPWLASRLDQYYEGDYYKAGNNIPLTRVHRRPGFVVKNHKVELREWGYSQYNEYIDNINADFDQKNNLYVYPRNKQIGDGYKHIVEIMPSVYDSATDTYTPGNVRVTDVLMKAPDFPNAPVKEKYFILQKQHPDYPQSPDEIKKFFYQDYKNLFFVEYYTANDFKVIPYALPPASDSKLGAIAINKEGAAVPAVRVKAAPTIKNGDFGEITPNPAPAAVTIGVPPAYRFFSFDHHRVNDLLDQLSKGGVKGLFDWAFTLSGQNDQMNFSQTYEPTGAVIHNYRNRNLYPNDTLDFWLDAPTAIYNWELFFHIPMFIANKLMQEQRFMDAMDWYHLVFNPTNQKDSNHGGDSAARFWQFFPFFEHSVAGVPSIEDIMSNSNLPVAVQQWAKDPFKPHLIARNRIGAYMRNVVMKYLDNLLAWGDNLFRRDTMESINEATLLYVLAAQLLGKRPVKIPARLETPPKDYEDLLVSAANGEMNAFSNALVTVQTYLAATTTPPPVPVKLQMYYFCIPPNEKLLSYWDVVADRLYKIRNSQNIDGVERQLALFEPPIDPAMLVRAAAAGISIADAVAEMYAPLPAYRFQTMVQKATELAQEVKSLGGALLAAIEKRDAEQLALLRSVQEQKVLEATKEARTLQIQEAQAQVAGLNEQKELINDRIKHYQRLVDKGLNREEQLQLESLQASVPLKVAQGALSSLSSVFFGIPEFNLQTFVVGTTYGGTQLGNALNGGATAVGIAATVNDINGSMAGIKGSFARRREEWDLQIKLANREIKQIEKQIIAAEIRQSIAEKELRIHEIQIQNARDMDVAMHDKYSNEDLYNWMISEISYTYFQSYKLAFDIARKAERCYRYELGVEPVQDFIKFGYWNSLKKGLLAADNLAFDIKRLEMAYLDQNVRYHELSKSISLAAVDPVALINLRANAKADISLPEWLFDMDYPGHYFRRIKSVSISIPCVAGPYTTVAAKLTLISSKYRKNALAGNSYGEIDSDPRFNYLFNGGQSIATSTAQNDSGMFELNFRDERYLPFEGCGAVSNWKLDLPSAFANYDRNTITDVIIHVNYTARYDGGLGNAAKTALETWMADNNPNTAPQGIPPYHLLSLKHEFSTEWYAAFQSAQDVSSFDSSVNTNKAVGRLLSIALRKSHFPIGVQSRTITIAGISLISRKSAQAAQNTNQEKYKFSVDTTSNNDLPDTTNLQSPVIITFPNMGQVIDNQPQTINLSLYKTDSGGTSGLAMAESDLDDLYLLIEYTAS